MHTFNNVLVRFGTNFLSRNDGVFHLVYFPLVLGRVIKQTIARLKALSQTKSEIASDLKVNKFSGCYNEKSARNRFLPRSSAKQP